MIKENLLISHIIAEAKSFALAESRHREKSLLGVTDGKAVGTYLEHKFQDVLSQKYTYVMGCLTISNALQWRLQYSRVIENAGTVKGVIKVK